MRHARSGFLLLLLLVAASAKEEKVFVPPPVQPAGAYPLKDVHSDEKVTIAAEVYDTAEKAAIFYTDYPAYGFLPVRLIISNDNDSAISLRDAQVEMILRERTHLLPLTEEDFMRRLSEFRPQDLPSSSPIRIPLPIPLPKKDRNKAMLRLREEVESAELAAIVVDAHSTQAGFMFFDVRGLNLQGAELYVTRIRDSEGHKLFYFEIPLHAGGDAAEIKDK